MEFGELLKAENERLVSEMASMKKKIKLAMKKQQAEFQAKIQAAEQRAAAAEAAAMSNDRVPILGIEAPGSPQSGSNGAVSVSSSPSLPRSGVGDSTVVRESSSSFGSSNGEFIHPLSPYADGEFASSRAALENLVAELKAERELFRAREEEALKERQRLVNECIELRMIKDAGVRQGEEASAKYEEELRLVKEDAEQRIGHLTKANAELDAQLIGAASQVADAFARMSSTNDEMERMSREFHETKRAHTNFATECESKQQELEHSRAALADAQKKLQEKTKEMEEMVAARRSAQEGQEAAMSQLMHRLDQMEAAGTGQQAEHVRELNADKVQSLVQEKADLQNELEKSTVTISNLQEIIAAYKNHFLSLEAGSQNMAILDSESIEGVRSLDSGDHLDKSISNLKARNDFLVAQHDVGSQAAAICRELEKEEPRAADEQAASLSVQELFSLREQLQYYMANQQAAEDQIKRLSAACSEAERQVETVLQELTDAHANLDTEIKLRDDKYMELDAKFGRLQKRAKQRIQEVQKEKEDIEAQLAAAGVKAAQALSKQAALQNDLDRARLQAGEAHRALDNDRQQLRKANMKLREELEEIRRTLEGKEHNLAESRRLASEKDQTALEMAAMSKEAEVNHEAVIVDLKDKHRKVEENLKAQLTDAVLDNSKMTETISTLQTQLGLKESKLAELEAASSGEVVRLGASLEAAKQEVSRMDLEHKMEQEVWEANSEKLNRKLKDLEKVINQQEMATAELKSQYESELERQRRAFTVAQADLLAARNETTCVASDLASYKVRAYALLQKKEAELLAAKDSNLAAAQEKALQNAKREAIVAAVERENAVKALQDAVSEYENKLAARDVSVLDAEQRIRDLATKLEASRGQLLSEQDEWQSRLQQLEATWRSKCDALEAKLKGSVESELRHEYTTLLSDYNNLKGEFESFRNLVDTMIEDKDTEIAHLLEDNASLQRSSAVQAWGQPEQPNVQAYRQPDTESAVVAVAEQQILVLARQQAQREEQVSQCQRHIQVLQEEIADLERENRLHSQQEALLKEELRNLERAQRRDGVDMTYLKNVILKLLETGEVEVLLPVVAMLLQFSPEELKRCHDTYNTTAATSKSLSGAAAVVDTAVSVPRSFFSKLNFAGGI